MAEHYGFDNFLLGLMTRGVPWMAEKARRELTLMEEFVMPMMAKYPPDYPIEGELAAQEMAGNMAALESEAGQKRLMGNLEQLRQA